MKPKADIDKKGRTIVIKGWNTRWYANKRIFSDHLIEDNKIRKFLKRKYFEASVAKIEIERAADKATVSIYTARPGMLIGKGGVGVETIKAELNKLVGRPVNVNIMEIRNPDACAQLVAENIAAAIEKGTSYRRAMKQAMDRAMQANAKGIKITCAARLGGAEIARSEDMQSGTIPLQTIRANIEYGNAEAATNYGRIYVKVLSHKDDVLDKTKKESFLRTKHSAEDELKKERILQLCNVLSSIKSIWMKDLWRTPYVEYVQKEYREKALTNINLSYEEMLQAEHVLSLLEKNLTVDLSNCNQKTREYIEKVVEKGNISKAVSELALQIVLSL